MAYRHYYLTEPGADLLAKWLEDRGKDCPEWLLDDTPELDEHNKLNAVAECFGSEVDNYVLTVLTDRPNPLTSHD